MGGTPNNPCCLTPSASIGNIASIIEHSLSSVSSIKSNHKSLFISTPVSSISPICLTRSNSSLHTSFNFSLFIILDCALNISNRHLTSCAAYCIWLSVNSPLTRSKSKNSLRIFLSTPYSRYLLMIKASVAS